MLNIVKRVSDEVGIPANILLSVIAQESSFKWYDRVPDGKGYSYGYMMLYDYGALADIRQQKGDEAAERAKTDPYTNVYEGASMLMSLYQKTGNWADAASAYNQGLGGLKKNGRNKYGDDVWNRANSQAYIDAANNLASTATVQPVQPNSSPTKEVSKDVTTPTTAKTVKNESDNTTKFPILEWWKVNPETLNKKETTTKTTTNNNPQSNKVVSTLNNIGITSSSVETVPQQQTYNGVSLANSAAAKNKTGNTQGGKNCVNFARARVAEITGINTRGGADNYGALTSEQKAKTYGYNLSGRVTDINAYRNALLPGAVISMSNGSARNSKGELYGHVIVVEGYDPSTDILQYSDSHTGTTPKSVKFSDYMNQKNLTGIVPPSAYSKTQTPVPTQKTDTPNDSKSKTVVNNVKNSTVANKVKPSTTTKTTNTNNTTSKKDDSKTDKNTFKASEWWKVNPKTTNTNSTTPKTTNTKVSSVAKDVAAKIVNYNNSSRKEDRKKNKKK